MPLPECWRGQKTTMNTSHLSWPTLWLPSFFFFKALILTPWNLFFKSFYITRQTTYQIAFRIRLLFTAWDQQQVLFVFHQYSSSRSFLIQLTVNSVISCGLKLHFDYIGFDLLLFYFFAFKSFVRLFSFPSVFWKLFSLCPVFIVYSFLGFDWFIWDILSSMKWKHERTNKLIWLIENIEWEHTRCWIQSAAWKSLSSV